MVYASFLFVNPVTSTTSAFGPIYGRNNSVSVTYLPEGVAYGVTGYGKVPETETETHSFGPFGEGETETLSETKCFGLPILGTI